MMNTKIIRQLNIYREALRTIAYSPPWSNRLDEISEDDPEYRRGNCVYCGTKEGDEHYMSCEWHAAIDALMAFDDLDDPHDRPLWKAWEERNDD